MALCWDWTATAIADAHSSACPISGGAEQRQSDGGYSGWILAILTTARGNLGGSGASCWWPLGREQDSPVAGDGIACRSAERSTLSKLGEAFPVTVRTRGGPIPLLGVRPSRWSLSGRLVAARPRASPERLLRHQSAHLGAQRTHWGLNVVDGCHVGKEELSLSHLPARQSLNQNL